MSKQSRLNKEKAARAKADQDKQSGPSQQQNRSPEPPRQGEDKKNN